MTKITIEEFLTAARYHITGGDKFQWSCYGPHARFLDCESLNEFSATIVYDTKTQFVYEVDVYDYRNKEYTVAIRWIHSKFDLARKQESQNRKIDDTLASDDTPFINTDDSRLMLYYIDKIVQGQHYDLAVDVKMRMQQSLIGTLTKKASDVGVTFDKLVASILEDHVKSKNISSNRRKKS